MKRKRERIYLVPLVAGLVYAAFVLLVFAAGFVWPGPEGLPQILGIALVVVGVVVLIQCNDNLRGVEIVSCASAPAPAGGEVVLEVLLRNNTTRERVGLKLREGWRWRGRRRIPDEASLPVLEAGELRTLRLRFPAGIRGSFAVPPLWVCSVMPVGLCFAWKAFAECGEYFVYPTPRGISRREALGGAAGELGTEAETGGEDVSGHRPYETGDPPSRMDWRVFARSGRLVVRTLEDGGGGAEILRWADTGFLDDTEARLEQLSYWMAQCLRDDCPFTLELEPGGRPLSHRNLNECYLALARFGGGA